MIKIVVDCFGGDKGVSAAVAGCVDALDSKSDLALVLTGDCGQIEAELSLWDTDRDRIEIVHAPEVIGCDEKPTEAIRAKRESSMVKAFELLRNDDSMQGMVTVGSTGVALTGAVLRVGRLDGVERPAFCPLLPTMQGGIVGICDSGANVETTPSRLVQFAIMGSEYMRCVCGIKSPRVALLNVGTERGKGDTLHIEAHEQLSACGAINFVGNMESRDLLSGRYDLVVCDGFSGNVLIKTTEGTCLELLGKLKQEIYAGGFFAKLGALLLKPVFARLKSTLDYNNYGGAVMLGTKKPIIKGHGTSNATGISQCIIQAYDMVQSDISEKIEKIIVKENG